MDVAASEGEEGWLQLQMRDGCSREGAAGGCRWQVMQVTVAEEGCGALQVMSEAVAAAVWALAVANVGATACKLVIPTPPFSTNTLGLTLLAVQV